MKLKAQEYPWFVDSSQRPEIEVGELENQEMYSGFSGMIPQ